LNNYDLRISTKRQKIKNCTGLYITTKVKDSFITSEKFVRIGKICSNSLNKRAAIQEC